MQIIKIFIEIFVYISFIYDLIRAVTNLYFLLETSS